MYPTLLTATHLYQSCTSLKKKKVADYLPINKFVAEPLVIDSNVAETLTNQKINFAETLAIIMLHRTYPLTQMLQSPYLLTQTLQTTNLFTENLQTVSSVTQL